MHLETKFFKRRIKYLFKLYQQQIADKNTAADFPPPGFCHERDQMFYRCEMCTGQFCMGNVSNSAISGVNTECFSMLIKKKQLSILVDSLLDPYPVRGGRILPLLSACHSYIHTMISLKLIIHNLTKTNFHRFPEKYQTIDCTFVDIPLQKQMICTKRNIGFSEVILFCISQLTFVFKKLFGLKSKVLAKC